MVVMWPLTFYGPSLRADHAKAESEAANIRQNGHKILDFVVQPDGKLILVSTGLNRLLPDGAQDNSFHRDDSLTRGPTIYNLLVHPNGELIFSIGDRLSYVSPDGAGGPKSFIASQTWQGCFGLAVQNGGSILATCKYGLELNGLVRVLRNGQIDQDFHSAVTLNSSEATTVRALIDNDGKILLAGWVELSAQILLTDLSNRGKQTKCFGYLARLNPDGSLDDGFRANHQCLSREKMLEAAGPLSAFAMLRDGSLLAVFSGRDSSRKKVVHLDSTGREIKGSRLGRALGRLGFVTSILRLDDGRLLVGGDGVRSFMSDGTPDASFQMTEQIPSVVKLQLHGEKIMVLDEQGTLHRLLPDGAIDTTFQARYRVS